VTGLVAALSRGGFETHLWFVGDSGLVGYEQQGALHLHRWCQWISRYHPQGVYDGEDGKFNDYAASLPPRLLEDALRPRLVNGARAVILAEEWHTVHAVLHLDGLLRAARLRDRVRIFWNANNMFGFGKAAKNTAQQYAWRRVVEGSLYPECKRGPRSAVRLRRCRPS
jgi:hypothetical protein